MRTRSHDCTLVLGIQTSQVATIRVWCMRLFLADSFVVCGLLLSTYVTVSARILRICEVTVSTKPTYGLQPTVPAATVASTVGR